jgi:acetyl esterase/lipase
VAGFSGAPTNGDAPLTVTFADQSTGTITSRSWDFGDGSASSEAAPMHVYALPGRYTVTLTVTGTNPAPGVQDESDSATSCGYVDVTDPAGGIGYTLSENELYFDDGTDCGDGDGAHCLDVYLPDRPLDCAPTVLWIHGGGWSGGSKGFPSTTVIATGLAAAGYPVVVPNYTLADYMPCAGGTGVGSYPAAIEDVKRAVDWIHRVGTSTHGLHDGVVVCGTSSGGQLALLAAFTQGPGESLFDPDLNGDYRVDAVIAFAGPSNFVKTGCIGSPWSSACTLACPPPDPSVCLYPPGCDLTGGFGPGYPCHTAGVNCNSFDAPETFLGQAWPPSGAPAGVDCGDPLSLPAGLSMPTGIAWYDASPLFWISGEEPPVYLFHGECDGYVPAHETSDLEASLFAAGVFVQARIEAAVSSCDIGCQHAADGLYPLGASADQVRAVLAELYGTPP